MTKTDFTEIENYMISQMQDSAHDRHHVYRVLNAALDIAGHEENVDMDILITACLLHDVGREKQFANLELCHAQIGSEMAYEFLLGRNWKEERAAHVKACILTHRFRKGNPPESIEAKILFDADKLDVTGAIGLARTLIYEGQVCEPLYIMDDQGNILVEGGGDEISSFFQEYNYKLNKLETAFYTERAKELAVGRKKISEDFYNSLYHEIQENYRQGADSLSTWLKES